MYINIGDNMKIKDIPISERPRERLINSGVNSLSNEEVIALILKTGRVGESSKVLAMRIISSVDTINELRNLSYNQMLKIKGIGPSKATTLLAAIELGSRLSKKQISINNKKITNSALVYDYYKNLLGNEVQERFYALYLDNSKTVIKDKLLFIGTINYSIVHPREIFREAYLVSASSIICIHNHPSGSLIPSGEDINLTKRLVEISTLLGVKIIDHIIVSSKGYYSFYENNLI